MSGNLTWKKENGEWGIDGVDLTALPPAAYGALCKLKDIEHPATPTNGDRFRAMTDEELGELPFCPYEFAGKGLKCQDGGEVREVTMEECDKCALNWYRDPAEV